MTTAALKYPHWPAALADARRGDLSAAEAGLQAEGENDFARGIFGRCLAEAGERLDEAVALIERGLEVDKGNPLLPHALALAVARRDGEGDRARADTIWKKHKLPHDLGLLGQTAFTLEAQWRPPAAQAAAALELPWPAQLPRPEPVAAAEVTPEVSEIVDTEKEAVEAVASDVAGLHDPAAGERDVGVAVVPHAKPKLNAWAKSRAGKLAIAEIDKMVDAQQFLKVLELSGGYIGEGKESAELHLIAGAAAESLACWERARAHLARGLLLEPGMHGARLLLGRVYWRTGWVALALALWRSLPVDGPFDYDRHYHLALGHAAAGDRAAANEAMDVALTGFYMDTRNLFIERALELWRLGSFGETVNC